MPILFACPKCKGKLSVADDKAGNKFPCPKCGQRLQVPAPPPPPPVPATDKTMLGDLVVPELKTLLGEAEPKPQPEARMELRCLKCRLTFYTLAGSAGSHESCPSCGALVTVPPLDRIVPAAPIQEPMIAPVVQTTPPSSSYFQPATSTPENPWAGVEETNIGPSETGHSPRFRHREHSGLGIASFLIALLVGGLDILLGIVIAVNITHSESEGEIVGHALAGGIGMYCFNCMSIPLCLVGAGLAGVALVAHRDRNHLFTWMGLLGNGLVIVAVLGFYVVAQSSKSGTKTKAKKQGIEWRLVPPSIR